MVFTHQSGTGDLNSVLCSESPNDLLRMQTAGPVAQIGSLGAGPQNLHFNQRIHALLLTLWILVFIKVLDSGI